MMMPGREYQAQPSRFGFNGKENDHDVKGFGNQQDYGMRIYDTRIGRFLSIDPITKSFPMLTPYQFASNRPIDGTDLDGLEWSNSVTEEKTNETTVKRVTDQYLKVRVINTSSIVTDAALIRKYAEAFKSSTERKYSSKGSIVENGLTVNWEVKTTVILDYRPDDPDKYTTMTNPDGTERTNPDGTVMQKKVTPLYARLVFDDRVTTTDANGVIHSTPGDTKGAINSFTIALGITMDGKQVPISDLTSTSDHEVGHSAGLNHPWKLSGDEKLLFPELDQMNPQTANKKAILKNLLNSYENPDVKFRNNQGSTLLVSQLFFIVNQIRKRAQYTPDQLKSNNPELEKQKSQKNN